MINYKKILYISLICGLLIFCWFWTEGFGLTAKYEYGTTMEKALNFYNQKGISNIKLTEVVSTIEIDSKENLVFYETNKNTLTCSLLRKKWNNKWIVIAKGGEIPLDYKSTPEYSTSRLKPPIQWNISFLKEFSVTFGVAYHNNIEAITVGQNNAAFLTKHVDRKAWYSIGKNGDYYSADVYNRKATPGLDVQGYDKDNKVIYSYYPQ